MIRVLKFFFLLLIISSCSGPKKAPSPEPVNMPTAQLEDGRVLYNQYCQQCHPGGMAGLGPAIINKPLPKFLMRFQIRHGLGVMPDFDEDLLSDNQVKNIARYLVYLRKEARSAD